MAPGLLRDLLPPIVAVTETFGEPRTVALFPEERAAVAGAVTKRRREFAGVRFCARSALERLGHPAVPIVPGSGGAPGWPVGIVGSMTHCEGYCAGAVAPARDVLAVGIDAEPAAPLPPGVLDMVALPDERDALAALYDRHGPLPWDRLLFSAKESVYKAWFPLAGTWLDFHEARVSFVLTGVGRGTFGIELLRPAPASWPREPEPPGGAWQAGHGLVATAVLVPNREPRH